MSVTWTETATDQLVALQAFIARSSPRYARSMAGDIVRASDGLAGQPYFGAEVPEYADAAIREIYVHPARIIYFTDGQDVRILSVIHSSKRLPRTPPV